MHPAGVVDHWSQILGREIGQVNESEWVVQIGGWHDFRHTLSRTLRRAGVHPVVIKDTLHHSKVDLAMNVYDKSTRRTSVRV